MSWPQRASNWSGLLGLALLLTGSGIGLFHSPRAEFMGDVVRILYVHVPTAWVHMVCYLIAFVCGLAALWSGERRWDYTLTGAVETGVVLNVLLLIQGMIWGEATWEGAKWGWTWADARLTTSLLTVLIYGGILALGSFVDEPDKRSRWMAVANTMAFLAVMFNYYAPEIFPGIHQISSSPETIAASFKLPLRINAFGMLFLAIWFIGQRSLLERRRRQFEDVEAPERLALLEES